MLTLFMFSFIFDKTYFSSMASFSLGALFALNFANLELKNPLFFFSVLISSLFIIFYSQIIKMLPNNMIAALSLFVFFVLWGLYDRSVIVRNCFYALTSLTRGHSFFVYLSHEPILSVLCSLLFRVGLLDFSADRCNV